ncbi:hypothetical protein GLX30_32915 [Streptomyces sp. Tu 2975]|uniref:hypothetical protein n=1 Tax=Streptomyces sp. Tu 2975 TaxID=2676871 RepID=UPI001357A8AD|nr:hypothetical protein [Streptomyces sp. Tu 2975]QIP88024.1 hypothetical protein GLX30_32915 [Streptomyces sp. Tu 2975]
MRKPTEIESAHIASVDEILACDLMTVEDHEMEELGEQLEAAPGVFLLLPEWKDVPLGSELARRTPRFNGLGCRWRTKEPLAPFEGEFWITDLFVALLQEPPDLAWEGTPAEESALYEQFRVVDSTPVAATGQFTAVRVQPGVAPLELWYYDMDLNTVEGRDRQYVRLELTYPDYLDALLLTKGTFGWQYLFADVSLRSEGFERVLFSLRSMVEAFPRLFPDHDYSDLRARLEARL